MCKDFESLGGKSCRAVPDSLLFLECALHNVDTIDDTRTIIYRDRKTCLKGSLGTALAGRRGTWSNGRYQLPSWQSGIGFSRRL